MSEWIDVKQELPVGEDRLLFCAPSKDEDFPFMAVGYFNRLTKTWFINGEMHHDFPASHWMPLPAPPTT